MKKIYVIKKAGEGYYCGWDYLDSLPVFTKNMSEANRYDSRTEAEDTLTQIRDDSKYFSGYFRIVKYMFFN
jgi:hypothetical protein